MKSLFTIFELLYNTFEGMFGKLIAEILSIIIIIAIIVIILAILIRIFKKIKYCIVTRNMTTEEKYKYDQHHKR